MFPIDSSELYPAELDLKLLERNISPFLSAKTGANIKMLQLFYCSAGRLFQYIGERELFGIILVDPH